jgi:hypothetical protein
VLPKVPIPGRWHVSFYLYGIVPTQIMDFNLCWVYIYADWSFCYLTYNRGMIATYSMCMWMDGWYSRQHGASTECQKFLFLGDDRNIQHVYVDGRMVL